MTAEIAVNNSIEMESKCFNMLKQTLFATKTHETVASGSAQQ